MGEWAVDRGAIVECPREVDEQPLLASIYRRRDALLREWATGRGDRTFEVAFGTYPYPETDANAPK